MKKLKKILTKSLLLTFTFSLTSINASAYGGIVYPTIDKCTPNETGTVNTEKLNIRNGAGEKYTAIDSIPFGEKVEIKGSMTNITNWYFIFYKDNNGNLKKGWVLADFIKKSE